VSPDTKTKTSLSPKKSIITPRRRYRPRKLISDDDCSDTSENDHLQTPTATTIHHNHNNNNNNNHISTSITKKSTKHSRLESNNLRSSNKNNIIKNNNNNNVDRVSENINNRISKDCSTTTTTTTATTTTDSANENVSITKNHVSFDETNPTSAPPLIQTNECLNNTTTTTNTTTNSKLPNNKSLRINKDENIYESVNNLKCCNLLQQQQQRTSEPQAPNCCLLDVNHCSFHIDEQINKNDTPTCTVICRDCSIDPNSLLSNCNKPSSKKKLLRKSRSRRPKQSSDEPPPVARMRSLSVGNENCYKNIQQTQDERWKSSLRRHELIQIIRESMEKNRLCFQANR
jgi:hypothetical protein